MSASESIIYLDNNATTRPSRECIAAVCDALELAYGNPSSKHRVGDEARRRLLQARAQTAALLGATPAEIVYTSGATESNHAAILGSLRLHPYRRHIVSSRVEHPSTLLLYRQLEAQGVRVTLLPVDADGRLDLDDLERALSADTTLVSLMWANNETGVVFPIEQAAHIARARGVLFHTDAVQAVGRLPIDLGRLPVDLLSLSGHKLHAPKGIGALFMRKGLKWPPLLFGHQERGRRGGTENLPAIAGLGVASDQAARGLSATAARIAGLRARLETGILARIPYARINGAAAERVPNTSNVRFGTLDAEPILERLDRAGVVASSGSACTSGGTEPSHVLTAMGLERGAALASVRFSLSRETTAEEIDRVLELLPGIITHSAAQAA